MDGPLTGSESATAPEWPNGDDMVRFGPWQLALDSYELQCGDTLVRLERKQAQLLIELLRRAPHTVSHEALREAVWAEVIVGDNTLHQAVAALRRAFADSARDPRYIRTEARRGYRWIGPGVESSTANDSDAAIPRKQTAAPARTRWRRWAGIAALCTVGFMTLALSYWRPASELPPPRELIAFEPRSFWIAPFESSTTANTPPSQLDDYRQSLVSAVLEIGAVPLLADPQRAQYHVLGRTERKNGATRIRLQLNHPAKGQALWSHPFSTAEAGQTFVQATMAAGLLTQVAHWFGVQAEILSRDFADPTAVREFTRGQVEWHSFVLGAGGNARVAVAHFEESLRLQPDFWLPQQQLAILYGNRLGPDASYAEHRHRTHESLKRLLALRRLLGKYADTMVWEGAFAIASQRQELDYQFSESMWQAAVDRGWNQGQRHSEVAGLHAARGNLERAVELYEAARAGDSQLNQTVADLWLGYTLIAMNQLPQAKAVLSEAAMRLRDDGAVAVYTHVLHVFALQLLNDPEAEPALERAWQRYGAQQPDVFAGILALGGKTALARSVLGDLQTQYEAGQLTRHWHGVIGHLFLGEPERALDWLERTIENREASHISHIKRAAYLDPLRAHQRFQQALARLKALEQEPSPLRELIAEHEQLSQR